MKEALDRFGILVPFPKHVDGIDTVTFDRMFEALLEGVVRMSLVAMMEGACTTLHPYDSAIGALYASDPRDMGRVKVNNSLINMTELWSPAFYAAEQKWEDCDGLSLWLAAWYRFHGIEARAAVYPSINVMGSDGRRKIGRHVCVFVPYIGSLYRSSMPPFGVWESSNGRGVIRAISRDGYIEDPSIALGMSYYLRGERLPARVPFTTHRDVRIDNRQIIKNTPSFHHGEMFYVR